MSTVGVYVEGWQHGCCGDELALGTRVAWRLLLRPDAWWPNESLDGAGAPPSAVPPSAVPLSAVPLSAVPLSAEARTEWSALGNDPGPDPVLLHQAGLVVFVPDASAIVGGRVTGGLQEDRHVDVPWSVAPTAGTVRRIRLVSRIFRTTARDELVAVPGRDGFHDVPTAPRMLPEAASDAGPLLRRLTTGLLVDLQIGPG